MKISPLISLGCCLLLVSFSAGAQVSVWTYHNNNQRTGLDTNETILNLTNVNSTAFGKLFSWPVDGYVYAQPLYVPNLNIQGATHNVVFVATEHNSVYAFDANSAGASGGLLWQTNLGLSAVTTIPNVFTNKSFGTRYNNNSYTDIEPEVGITGTPVIDTNSGTLYVDAFTQTNSGGTTNYFHRMHALNIFNGTERPYSPVVITTTVAGSGVDSVFGRVTFNAKQENQRPALTLAGGILYVAYAGYADTDPYHGWILGFNATNLTLLTNYVFILTPNSTAAEFPDNPGEGGIWMSGGGFCVDANTNLYVSVANGSFDGKTEYGDSFMKFTTSNGLAVADYFTPWNQATLQQNDSDLGSGGLLLLPDQPGTVPHEMLGAGKIGEIYLVNRDQFTTNNEHYDSTNSIDFVRQTSSTIGGSFDTPAYFNNAIYYVGSGDSLKAIPLANGLISGSILSGSRSYGFPGATPSISANGTNNGIVWTLQMGSPQVLVACNATNVAKEIYNSSQAAGVRDQLASGAKFAVPTVADGEVFVGGAKSFAVFGLLAGTFSFSPVAYSVPKGNTNAIITVSRMGGTNGAVQVAYATVSGGTAASGVNYTAVSGVLNWTNGESSPKTFTVPILDDGQVDPDETVNLALSNPTNGSALGVQSAAVLTIIAPPIDLWKLTYFGANANNPAVAGDSADPALDGIPNLLKYAFGANPTVPGTNQFTGTLVGSQFQLYFPRNTAASDITYLVQASGDLSVWSNLLTFTAASGWVTNVSGATVSESATNGVVPNQYVNVTATTSTNTAAGTGSQFLRLQIHR